MPIKNEQRRRSWLTFLSETRTWIAGFWRGTNRQRKHVLSRWSSGGIKRWLCLSAIAVGPNLSGCSWGTVTVRPTLEPPSACSLQCPRPPYPPGNLTEAARRGWEFDVLKAGGDCFGLHETCREGLEAQRSMLKEKRDGHD